LRLLQLVISAVNSPHQKPSTQNYRFQTVVIHLQRLIMEGAAFEDYYDKSANARAGPGTEKLALKLSGDGKTLSVLYAYDVSLGVTEPIPLAVHSKTTSYVVAAGQQILGETAVILDVKSWKAVVSFTGQGMLGIKGSSYLVQCR
jgi:hypothetical protein